MEFDKLYKISATGGVLVWEISVAGDEIEVTHGYLDGAKQVTRTKIKEAKSAATINEQAIFEARSKWDLKRKEYSLTIEDAETASKNNSLTLGGYKPMLAKNFDDFASKIRYPYYAQPKLDGFRCIARKIDDEVRLFSRKGAEITTVPHINHQLQTIMLDGEIYDGELYTHNEEFEKISGLLRSTVNKKDTRSIQYWVYDAPRIFDLNESDPFNLRYKSLVDTAVKNVLGYNIILTETELIHNKEELDAFHDSVTKDSYEGAILRRPTAAYENKRSKDLLKVKVFKDNEYRIIGYNEGKGKLEGHVGSFICQMENGSKFNVKLDGSEDKLRYYYLNPETFMGKWMTVKYFCETNQGIPRFPVGKGIREIINV